MGLVLLFLRLLFFVFFSTMMGSSRGGRATFGLRKEHIHLQNPHTNLCEFQEHKDTLGLIEGNAKCRHLNKLGFAAGVYLPEAQNPIPHPVHNVYSRYTYSHREGGGVS
jgi:hypothetical protein